MYYKMSLTLEKREHEDEELGKCGRANGLMVPLE